MSKTVSYTNVHLSYTADLQGLRQAKSDMAAMNRVINQTKSDTQKYEEHVQKLDRLLHNGKITQEQYNAAIAAARTKFMGATQAASSYRDILSQLGGPLSMTSMGGAAAVGFIGAAGLNQAKEAVQAYADLEATMTTLGVVYGDTAAAARDFAKMRAMAAVSPLETKDFTQAAQALAQYGVETDTIMMHLSRLSEISAGNSERMQSLSLAFAQVKANGRLMGQEVLQMVNAGFNPLAEISRTTGRSMQDLRKDMENGLITFEMVANAFKTATEDGGRFNDMNEKLGKTVNAQLAQMRDEVTKTYEAFGEMLTKGGVNSVLSETASSLKSITASVEFLKNNGGLDLFRTGGGLRSGADFMANPVGPNTQAEIARMAEEEAAFNKAREKMGGIIGSAISSIPSQIESAGKSYADSMRTMTSVLDQHTQEIAKTTIKQRAAEVERIKKQQEQIKPQKDAAKDSLKSDLPAAVELGTREAYKLINDSEKQRADMQLRKMDEQKQIEQQQLEVLRRIETKPGMGIMK